MHAHVQIQIKSNRPHPHLSLKEVIVKLRMKENDILVTYLSYMCDVLEEADDSKGSGGVKARGGLVEKDEGGVGENLLANAHTLTFTS